MVWVSILVLCYLARTIVYQHAMHFLNLTSVQAINSANSLVYSKIMQLSSSSRKYLETGSIMNNINVDIVSFYHFTTMSTFLFSSPIMIVTAVAMLIYEVGWIGLVAPFLFLIGLGFQRKLMNKGFAYRK